VLIKACLQLRWFPGRFKRVKIVVLQKLRKTPETYWTPGSYRLIALLLTIRKVIKVLVAQRVIKAAKAYSLLLVK